MYVEIVAEVAGVLRVGLGRANCRPRVPRLDIAGAQEQGLPGLRPPGDIRPQRPLLEIILPPHGDLDGRKGLVLTGIPSAHRNRQHAAVLVGVHHHCMVDLPDVAGALDSARLLPRSREYGEENGD